MRRFRHVVLFLLALSTPLSAQAVTLEQIISREHPRFQVAASRLAVGRDGMVYLSNLDPASMGPGWMLRLSRDGQVQLSGDPGPAPMFVTANAQGNIAVANAHFTHAITIHDKDLKTLAAVNDFTPEPGYRQPQHVEVGASGDFYGMGANKKHILRISPAGKVVTAIAYEPPAAEFRVHEKSQSLYLFANDWTPLRKIGFDGKLQWEMKVSASGGFDVDDAGILYALGANAGKILKFSPDGKAAGEIPLQLGDIKATLGKYPFQNLRVWGDEILLKRTHPTEMFLRFDLNSGALKQTVSARHERLAATFPEEVWTSGSTLPFSIEFTDTTLGAKPQWHVWARNVGALNWRELRVQDGKLQVPDDAAGLYQIKVTPEVRGWQRGDASEYMVRGIIEVRRPNSRGTANVFTPGNRIFYGQGETVPFSVLLRGAKEMEGQERPLQLRLMEDGSNRALAETQMNAALGQAVDLHIPASLTVALQPGNYRIEATSPDLTPVAQHLSIGPGLEDTPFLTIRYGDYGGSRNEVWPRGTTSWDSLDLVAANAQRLKDLGINMVAERMAWNAGQTQNVADAELQKRLQSDPLAVAPEKAVMAHPFLQSLAAFGANGTRQMAILLGNDAGLPIGTGYDPIGMDRLEKTITEVTGALQPYPAFRGWSWAANWWIFNQRGADAARTPEEKATYQAAVKHAYETGQWNPIIDTVAAVRWNMAPEATAQFNKILRAVSPDAKTAVAAPYRSGEAYPPQTFANVDEVDLQAQWEQIAPPNHAPHNVEYYKRPGKPAWGHPEIWNDPGTGEQILPTLFGMTMRGATGVGFANHLLNDQVEDARSPQGGALSVLRSLNQTLLQYGPWLNTLQSDDRVAIPVSSRMLKMDSWDLQHYWSVFEAFISSLHAHHPASIVFVEDLKPDSLKQYSAILLAGHKVEMEPALRTAIKNAHAAGAKVFYDGTSRAEWFKEYSPLGISFDKVGKDHGMGVGGDESTYARLPQYMKANLPALKKALDSAAKLAARIENDEIWATWRKSGSGRFLWVVNNTTPPLEPEQLWRMTLYSGSRLPVQANIGFTAPAPVVYDVFAMKRATPQNNSVSADLRTLPARLYAILPTAIGSVALRGPSTLTAGQSFQWWAQVRDESGKPIDTTVPLRLRLLGGDGSTLEQRFVASPAKGVYGKFTAPFNVPGDIQFLEVTELFSGKSTRLNINIKLTLAPHPFPLGASRIKVETEVENAITANASGQSATTTLEPATAKFGPHLRDITLSADGKIAVMNAMNWDNNLYAVDTASGRVLWRKQAGDYFALAPQSLENGFVAQGFDFAAPEGYHLYLAGNDGNIARRFALYGVPPRLPFRMYPQAMHDRINNFAAAPDANWIASAGNLGIAVWNRSGELLWSQDDWKEPRTESRANPTATWASTRPSTHGLLALDQSTLLAADDDSVTALRAVTGEKLWSVNLPASGEIRRIRSSRDEKLIALLSAANGGSIFVLRDGKLNRTLPAPEAYDFEISADGTSLALLANNQLKLYDTNGGLKWIFPGDERLRFARFSPDGQRIVASSDLGVVSVLDGQGRVLHERDLPALAVPAWLPDGELLLATWMGGITRLDSVYKERWSHQLQPDAAVKRPPVLATNTTQTTRIAGWGNAEKEPWPLTPNLLAQPGTIVRIPTVEKSPQNDLASLTDGKPDAPPLPWIYPGELNQWAGLRFFNPLTMTLKSPVRATGITFFEDAQHPNSWLRDADLEYFDAQQEKWIFLQPLLSNSAVHTHKFAQPVESSQFRIVLPFGLYGNLRLSEIVLHGER